MSGIGVMIRTRVRPTIAESGDVRNLSGYRALDRACARGLHRTVEVFQTVAFASLTKRR